MSKKTSSSGTEKLNMVTGTVIGTGIRVIILAALLVLFYYGVSQSYAFGTTVFSKKTVTGAPGIEMKVTVSENSSAMNVGKTLEQMGLIHSRAAFIFQKYFYEKKLQPGTYTLNTAMTVREILDTLSETPEEKKE